MISKGDLVKMRLSVKSDSGAEPLMELFILGKVANYCEDEDVYILEPRVISVPKKHVAEIETLAKDFDFEDVSMELKIGDKQRKRKKPPAINDIRFFRPSGK